MNHAKVSYGIYVLEFVTIALILQIPSKVSEIDVSTEIEHDSEN